MPSKSHLRADAARCRVVSGATVSFSRTFSAEEVRRFGDLTRDYNPVHYEPQFCATKGFDAPICHGMLVGSMICEPGGQWAWLASEMSFRFERPVYIGDTVTCTLTLRAVDDRGFARAEAVFTNQHDVQVITAKLAGYLPRGDAARVLQAMLDEGDPTNALRK